MALDLHKKAINGKSKRTVKKLELTEDIVNSKYFKDPLELLGEKSFGAPRIVPTEEIGTPIQEFYRDANVLITGGTGFMGKTLMEKLLRSIPHIRKIYLLIRAKKGKPIQERLEAIFEDRLFLRLKTEVPNFFSKLVAIEGDVSEPGLGLGSEDRQVLRDNVNIVFHGAATVRFDEKIQLAVAINVLGVEEMLKLGREIKNLKAFIHISTAFSHCPRTVINEEFYTTPYKYENIVELVRTESGDKLDSLTNTILSDWPNTYTFTKALAEDVIRVEGKGLPLAILRPAVIVSTYKEPVRGWIDNVYGPVGMIVGVGTGVLHTYLNDGDIVTDMVPVDMVVNSLIAGAWDVASTKRDSVPIFNYVSSAQKPIKWSEFLDINYKHGIIWPTIRAIWYYSYWPTKHKYMFYVLNFLLHTIPGFFLDGLASLTGREPMLTKVYSKLTKVGDTLEYFATKTWTWSDKNVQSLWDKLTSEDQELFFFDMGQMCWEYHAEALCLGLRVYLVHDDIETLPAARRKWQKLYYIHVAFKAVVYLTLLRLCWLLLSFLVSLSQVGSILVVIMAVLFLVLCSSIIDNSVKVFWT